MNPLNLLAAAALLALTASPAMAIDQVTPADHSRTIGTSAVLVLPSEADGVPRDLVLLQVDTAGASVSCSWNSSAPTLWGLGTFTLAGQAAPLIMSRTGADNVPTSALWCVASAANTVLTAESFP